MSRITRWILAAAVIQGTLIAVYWLVEKGRVRELRTDSALRTDSPRRVDFVFPALTLRQRDGGSFKLSTPRRTTLVHFWASWCPPCRTELPGLLALPTRYPIDVIAIALDKDWAEVDRLLNGRERSRVYLAEGAEVERLLGVRDLPVTLLLGLDGRVSLRFDGPRDWANRQFIRRWLLKAWGHG